MTFSEFSSDRRRAVWPEGEAEELVPNHKRYVADALIDLQNKIKCLRRKHYEYVPFDSTYWSCGASVFEAPRGFIHGLTTILADDQCSVVKRYPLTKPELKCLMADWKDCGLYKKPSTTYEISGVEYDYPSLPLGLMYVDAETDRCQRPRIGWFTLHDGQIWTYPALQSTEIAVLEWEGIKRAWDDADPVDFDREVEDVVELYLEHKTKRREDADLDLAAASITLYRDKVADLMVNCKKELALPQIEPCFSNCDFGFCATPFTFTSPDEDEDEDEDEGDGTCDENVIVETLAEMRDLAVTEVRNHIVYLLGYLAKYDSGPAKVYVWDAEAADADDPFRIVKLTATSASSPGRLIQVQ